MKKILYLIISISVFLLLGYLVLLLRPAKIQPKAVVKKKIELSESKYLNWRDAEIHYVDEGSGTPLVMIHGLGGSHRNFSKFAELMKSNFRVIRIDLPGFGLSDFPALNEGENMVDYYRSFMNDFITALALDSFYLMGNSMGGGISWMTAHDHPEKVSKLILCASAGYDMEKTASSAAGFIQNPITRSLMSKGVPLMLSKKVAERCWFDHSKINPISVEEMNLLWNKEGNIEAALKLGENRQFPDSNWIKEIACPTLVVWGRQDEIIPFTHAERFKRDIPNCKVVLYDSCGHIPMGEKAELLRTELLDFLN